MSSTDNDVKGGNATDDWDGEDDFVPETTNILSTRPAQPTYLDYPAGMVSSNPGLHRGNHGNTASLENQLFKY